MVLRGNSIATKATEVYLRLVGESYLSYLLADFAAAVLTEHAGKSTPPPASASKRSGSAHKRSNARSSTADCYEVDPAKLTSSTELLENQQNLLGLVETVWTRIVTSESHFPP